MKQLVSLLTLALFVTSCKEGPGSVVKRPGVPDVVSVEAEDPLMSAAIKKAGSTLTEFKAVLSSPPPTASGFAVKVGFPYGNNNKEHIWLTAPLFSAGNVSGLVGNDPVYIASLTLGQQVSVPEAQVSDWMYVQDGVLHGGFTIRALLKRMPPEEREGRVADMGFRLE